MLIEELSTDPLKTAPAKCPPPVIRMTQIVLFDIFIKEETKSSSLPWEWNMITEVNETERIECCNLIPKLEICLKIINRLVGICRGEGSAIDEQIWEMMATFTHSLALQNTAIQWEVLSLHVLKDYFGGTSTWGLICVQSTVFLLRDYFISRIFIEILILTVGVWTRNAWNIAFWRQEKNLKITLMQLDYIKEFLIEVIYLSQSSSQTPPLWPLIFLPAAVSGWSGDSQVCNAPSDQKLGLR